MHLTALVQDKAVVRQELQPRGLPCQPPPLLYPPAIDIPNYAPIVGVMVALSTY